ncbi:MAG: YdiU family protein [Methylococcales bacterium]|nr:YdiU family protein [Methylococcales bacterium]
MSTLVEPVKQAAHCLRLESCFTDALPADEKTENSPRQVYNACYSWVKPKPVKQPQLLAYSKPLAATLGLAPDTFTDAALIGAMAGNQLLPGGKPYAMCYSGHQFGHWAGQLGDGRAINLGEWVSPVGARWTLQLKGAGPTPYSRSADGLAVLRSSLREFVCSEAMHHLGVPTTRALTLVGTGEMVLRDMFYDGRPQWEPGAVVCRVAPTFLRFGSFEHHAARGEHALLKTLADFTLKHYFPELHGQGVEGYRQWFEVICRQAADLVVHWQRVGFVHGVLNTDNMSIIGQTLDYGPYGWLEAYDPNWTPNTTDAVGRRYRYGQQAAIVYWNLGQLANALYPLVNEVEPLHQGLAIYQRCFAEGWQAMMAAKLGLREYDDDLVEALLALLTAEETDYTLWFRCLAESLSAPDQEQAWHALQAAFYAPSQRGAALEGRWRQWLADYQRIRQAQAVTVAAAEQRMNQVNPLYVPRNYLTQQVLEQIQEGDTEALPRLMRALQNPYQVQPGMAAYAAKRPDWARDKPGCAMLSCSS